MKLPSKTSVLTCRARCSAPLVITGTSAPAGSEAGVSLPPAWARGRGSAVFARSAFLSLRLAPGRGPPGRAGADSASPGCRQWARLALCEQPRAFCQAAGPAKARLCPAPGRREEGASLCHHPKHSPLCCKPVWPAPGPASIARGCSGGGTPGHQTETATPSLPSHPRRGGELLAAGI